MHDNIRILSLEKDNKKEFIAILSHILEQKFGTSIDNIEDNYGYKYPWSLLSLIESDSLDYYGILYVDNKVWCASGGIIREFNGERVYQLAFRGLSVFEYRHKGLGVKPLGTNTLVKHQVSRAKLNNCKAAIMSFNEHNYKLFKVFNNFLMPQVFGQGIFEPSQTTIMFNNTPQWLLTMRL